MKRLTNTKAPIYLLLVLITAILLSSINFPYGFAQDDDGARIVENGKRFLDEGYQVSRTWGFPLYELAIYPIISYFGVFYAKLYSLVFYAAASGLFLLTLRKLTLDPLRPFLGALCFAVLPVSVISGNTVLETSQGMFFSVLALYSYLEFRTGRISFYFYLMAAALGLATSTRPDYLILSSAIALTILVFNREQLSKLALGALLWATLALLPFFIYEQIPFRSDVILPDPLWRKLVRALFGFIALLGIPAAAVVAFLALRHYRSWPALAKRVLEDDLLFLFLVTLVLYSVRFVMLPDELEYVYILVPLLIIVAIRLNVGRIALLLLLIAIALPNILQVHLFSRDSVGNLAFDPGVSPGVIAQDRSGRLKTEYQFGELPLLLDRTAKRYGHEEYSAEPSDEPNELLIISSDQLRYYQAGRGGGALYKAACRQQIVTYSMPSTRYWQNFIRFENWHRLEPGDFRKVTLPHCA